MKRNNPLKKMAVSVYKRLFQTPFVANFFGTEHSKRVLISYITEPFRGKESFYHSNFAEAVVIAKVFDSLGYIVDIIRYDADYSKVRLPVKTYDIVFGLEPNFLKAVERCKPQKSIYYATGTHHSFQNQAEESRLQDLEKRKGKRLEAVRTVPAHDSSAQADAVIAIGNDFTKHTYDGFCKQIETITISTYSFYPFAELEADKNWKNSQKNFLWFGSSGAVHKGLDLLLEIFAEHPEFQLYICGNVKQERDFMKLYKQELKAPNVHLIGWVDPSSSQFKELMLTCNYCILPSCSEAINGAVPTCMRSGLIPLVSKECGIDCDDCGVIFGDNSLECIESNIVEVVSHPAEWYKEKARQSAAFAAEHYSIEKFEADFRKALQNIL